MSYEDEINERLGPVHEGETRIFGVTDEKLIQTIKDALVDNFSVTIWTDDYPDEQICETDVWLSAEGIVHYYDEIMQGFNCFKTQEDMDRFREKIKQ